MRFLCFTGWQAAPSWLPPPWRESHLPRHRPGPAAERICASNLVKHTLRPENRPVLPIFRSASRSFLLALGPSLVEGDQSSLESVDESLEATVSLEFAQDVTNVIPCHRRTDDGCLRDAVRVDSPCQQRENLLLATCQLGSRVIRRLRSKCGSSPPILQTVYCIQHPVERVRHGASDETNGGPAARVGYGCQSSVRCFWWQ